MHARETPIARPTYELSFGRRPTFPAPTPVLEPSNGMSALPGTPRAVVALVLGIAAVGCGGAVASGAKSSPAPRAAPSPAPNAEVEAIYHARMDSALSHYTDADVRFMSGMIHHHAQALVMAEWAPSHGASPSVRTLCARIMNSQTDDIHLMQHWLAERGRHVPDVQLDTASVLIDGKPPMHMHGMLSDEQMRELDHATGTEFDRLFLKYMIQHHSGALTMVDDLFGTDGAGQDMLVFKFANDVQIDQKTEIARMQRMLDAISAGGRAP